jgi:hypothetical protein
MITTTFRRRRVVAAVLATTALVAVPVVVIARDGGSASRSARTGPTLTATPSPPAGLGSSAASSAPEPSYQPEPFHAAAHGRWRTTVPPELNVDAELPEPETELSYDGVAMRLCGAELFPTTGILDRRAVSSTGPEYAEIRDLRVFADDHAAHRFLVRIRLAVAACPEQNVGGTLWRHLLQPSALGGQETLTAVQTFETDGVVAPAANWWEVARVGNAVLLTGSGGELMPGRPLDLAIREHARGVQPIVRSMCVFAAGGCASGIPDDFPLADGYPEDDEAELGPGYGRHGPTRDLTPLPFVACGDRLADAPHDDRLLARWTNVEDFRSRQLTTFVDAEQAAARVAALTDFYRRCPTEDESDGYVQVTDVRRTAYGDESWAVVRRQELGGAPAVGLTVLHVVRVGRAVFVDTASTEGGAGEDPEADILRQVGEQARASAGVVAAMCAYTEAGCD